MSRPQRILVTGASGMVGSYARQVFAEDELTLTDVAPGATTLDIRQLAAVREAVASVRPDVVLHLAAATDVDRCQQEPDMAYHVNALGTQNLALACQALDVPLVYISTAAVFDGDKPDPYHEFDAPGRPANFYGASKLAGERVVASLLRRYYIVRAGWMIGGGPKDKKFVGKMTQLIRAGRTPLEAVHDKWGSPTYAKDLLQGIRALLETRAYGLYHMVNPGACTRYDMALAMRDALQRPDVEIHAVASDRFPLPAPRGRSEAMRNLTLELSGLQMMRPWREALHEYVLTEIVPALPAPHAGPGLPRPRRRQALAR